MRNRRFYFVNLLLLLATACTPAVSQQGTTDVPKASSLNNSAPKHYYKLNYVLRETDEGKLIDQRTFVITINPEESGDTPRWWSMRAGTRVPLSTEGGGKYSYADAGVNLDSRGYEVGDALQLEVSADVSSLATENQSSPGLPLIRQVKVRSAVLAPFGKQATVFTADDPGSTHRVELDVTPVRER